VILTLYGKFNQKYFLVLLHMTKQESIKNLMQIPGVGESIANDLYLIGILEVEDLKGKNPQELYEISNAKVGTVQDRCLLYVFRGAVYFAETPKEKQKPELLKWWNWKN
jgi:predicted RecB family nuclease